MTLEKICAVAEFSSSGRQAFKIGGKDVVVFIIDGSYHAIDRRCSHMGGDLSKGKLNGNTIKCPIHGAEFNIETGELVKQVGKMAGLVKKASNIKTYQIEVTNDELFIDI